MTRKTIIFDKDGYSLEVDDTESWSIDTIRNMLPRQTADRVILFWGLEE